MARTICIKPCPPPIATAGVYVPFMGSMGADSTLNLDGGCTKCEEVTSLIAQLNPVFGALGVPLCLLKCLSGFMKILSDLSNNPPDFAALATDAAAAIVDCECVAQFALPPPAGSICEFLKSINGILDVIDQVVDCVVELVTEITVLDVKAAVYLGDLNPKFTTVGQCLMAQNQNLMDILNHKFGSIGSLLDIIQPVITLLSASMSSIPAFGQAMVDLSNGMIALTSATPIGTPAGSFLTSLNTFKTTLDEVTVTFGTVVSICP